MERDGGSRAEGNGDMERTHLHLTCLPERYMRAKFSLSAYIFCWAIVKLCQVNCPGPNPPKSLSSLSLACGRLRDPDHRSPDLTLNLRASFRLLTAYCENSCGEWMIGTACQDKLGTNILGFKCGAPPFENVPTEASCSEDGESQQEETAGHRESTEPALEESPDTTEEYFETRSCYSDAFSEISHDADDCFRTPLSSETSSFTGGHLDSPKHCFGFRERLPSCAEQNHESSDGLQWKADGKHTVLESHVDEKPDALPLASNCSGMTLDVPGRDEVADFTNSFEETKLPPDSKVSMADPATVCFASNDSSQLQLFTEPVSKDLFLKTLTDSENETEHLSGNSFELTIIRKNEKVSQNVSHHESDAETGLISDLLKEVTCSQKPEALHWHELNHPDAEICSPQHDFTETHVVESLKQIDEVGVELSVVDSNILAKSECTSEHGHLQQDSGQSGKAYELLHSSADYAFQHEDLTSSQMDNEPFGWVCESDGVSFLEAPPVITDSVHYSIEGGPSSSSHTNRCVLSRSLDTEMVSQVLDIAAHTDHSEIPSEDDTVSDVTCTHSHLQDGAPDCIEPNSNVSYHNSEESFSSKTQEEPRHREEKIIVSQDSITFKKTGSEEDITPLSTIRRTPIDSGKMARVARESPKTSYVKEFTVIPQKEQEVIYSDNSDYADSHVLLSKAGESVSFGRVDQPSGQFETVLEESVTADDLCMNRTQTTICDLAYLSDIDEGVKKIPVYPKQYPSKSSARQLHLDHLTRPHAFERSQEISAARNTSSGSCVQAQSDLSYKVLGVVTSLHCGETPETVRDYGSDTNNNVKTVTSEAPCTLPSTALEQEHSGLECNRGQSFSERDSYRDIDSDINGHTNNIKRNGSVHPETSCDVLNKTLEQEQVMLDRDCGQSFSDRNSYCEDRDVTNSNMKTVTSAPEMLCTIPGTVLEQTDSAFDHLWKDCYLEGALTDSASKPVSFIETPESVVLTDNQSEIGIRLNLEAGNSSVDSYAHGHICDYLVEKECQLPLSAVEEDQTAGGFQLKDGDVINQGGSTVLCSSPHTDGQPTQRALIVGESEALECANVVLINGSEYREILREDRKLPGSCTFNVANGNSVKRSERRFDIEFADESTHSRNSTACAEPLETVTDVNPGMLSVTSLETDEESSFLMQKANDLEVKPNDIGPSVPEENCSSSTDAAYHLLHNGYGTHKDENPVKRVCFVADRPEDENLAPLSNGNIYDLVSPELDSISFNCEDVEDSIQSYVGSNCCAQGLTKNKETKSSSTGKGSRFSVFSRIPSFRKSKRDPKGANKVEPEAKESLEDGEEREEVKCDISPKRNRAHPSLHRSHMSHSTEHLKYADHTNDDIFEKAFALTCQNMEKVGQPKSMASAKQGRKYDRYGDLLHFKSSPMMDGFSQKKSSDNLNLRLKIAMAHKSLSNFFDTRSGEKENQRQIQNEDTKTRMKMKLPKEADLLKRTYSVPGSFSRSGHIHDDFVTSLAQNGLDLKESLEKDLKSTWHSDPLSKKTASLQDASGTEPETESDDSSILNGLASESDQASVDTFEAVEDEDSFHAPLHPTVFALANQLSPSWAKSLGSFEGLDTPMRPMSPKPQSPGMWMHRRSFRYPSRSVASSLCSLSQGQSMEVLSDRPQMTNTFRPRVAQLASAHSFDSEYLFEDSSSDSQSQTSLVSTNSGNES
ncbi:hypothetical protein NFI96_015724, partial [Prochilodus magdalenae]